MNKKFNIGYFAISLILILIATFYDFKIAEYLYNPTSLFGIFFAGYGILPLIIGLMFFGLTIYFRKNKIIGVLIIFLVYLFSVKFAQKNGINFSTETVFLLNMVIYFIPTIYLYKYFKNDDDLLRKVLLMLVLIILQYSIVHLIKIFWLRPRMIYILASNQKFLPWYIKGNYIENISNIDYILSFPSGHTSSSACVLALLFFKNNKFTKLLSVLFIISVALSRMILGMHFLSDVTFGSLITFICFIVLNYLNLKADCVNICESD